MMKNKSILVFIVTACICLISANLYASLLAEFTPCNSMLGKVVTIENDEIFSISVCEEVRVFKEFSYCYGVAVGDTVFFDGNPKKCEVIGFTVERNAVQCGTLCR